jgi:hypothetical protein
MEINMDEQPKMTTSQKINVALLEARAEFQRMVERIVANALDSNNDIIFRYFEQLAQDAIDVQNSSNSQARATQKNEWKTAKERRAKNKT